MGACLGESAGKGYIVERGSSPTLLSGEVTTKGACLGDSSGEYDIVELDSSPT